MKENHYPLELFDYFPKTINCKLKNRTWYHFGQSGNL